MYKNNADVDMCNASSLLKYDAKLNNTEIKISKIPGAGEGLFAKRQIRRSQPVVIYYGEVMTRQNIFNIYNNNPREYYELTNVLRGTSNGSVIKGEKYDLSALHGIYVNDIKSIDCDKQDINEAILRNYASSAKLCNLHVVECTDFPVYYSSKTIKKGEELYVHYGIGYWLMHIGMLPEEISACNQKYNFESFYKTS